MAVFSYYSRLSSRQKAIYRESDKIGWIRLPGDIDLKAEVSELEKALAGKDRRKVEILAREITRVLLIQLQVSPVNIKILAVRPSNDWGELHGLYEPPEENRRATISIWMRTARHKRIVAYRTFLRTLIHEICHHLDYELLKLGDSFHTEGFFKRESSLFKQLMDT